MMKKYLLFSFIALFLLVTSASWSLGDETFGGTTLKVPNGGTGASSFTAGQCLIGNGTGAITTGACGTGSGGSDANWTWDGANSLYTSTSSNMVGIGSSTPWGLLSVNPSAIGSSPEFVVGSSTRTDLIVTNGGKVGIGVSDPQGTLDINGGYLVNGTTVITSGRYHRAADGTAALNGFSFYNDTNFDTGLFRAAENTLGFSTGGSERMRISSSGNVGIGTTSPGALLHISGSGSTPAIFERTASSVYNQFKSDGASKGYVGYINLGTTGLGFLNATGNTANLLITDNGNVGIGTTNPNYKLEVQGSASSTSFSTNTLTIPSLATPAGAFLAVNPSGQIISTSTPSSMVYPGAGIALSTGSGWGASITNNSTNWNTAFGWGDHSVAGYSKFAYPFPSAATSTLIDFSNSIKLSNLATPAGAFLAVNPSGQIISTTTPSEGSGTVLSGTTGQIPYYAGNGTILTATSSIFLTDTEVQLGTGIGNFIVDPGIKVGIGTTSPYATLSVSGQVVGQYFTATSTTSTSTYSGGFIAGNNGAFVLNQSATANSLSIGSNGFIGIGMVNPSRSGIRFQIGQNGEAMSFGDGSNSSVYMSFASGAVTRGMMGYNSGDTDDMVIQGGPGKGILFITSPSSGGTSVFASPSFVRMRVDANGNLGIGTALPTYKLDVVGNGHFTSYVDASYFVGTSTLTASSFNLASSTLQTATTLWNTNFYLGTDGLITSLIGEGLQNTVNALTFDCSEVEGAGINCVGEDITLDATGDWTGTLDGINGTSIVQTSRSINTTYPIQGGGALSGNLTLSLGFGTTTPNVWSQLNTFSNASSTLFTATTAWIPTLLGSIDAGGALSFEIPNSSSPTLNAAGQIALDTTSNNFLISTSSSGSFVAASATSTLYSFSLASSTPFFGSGKYKELPANPLAQVITGVMCKVSGGTSKVINFSDDGTNDTNSITCTTSWTQTAITQNNSFNAYEVVRLETGATTGAVDDVIIRIVGYQKSD